MRRPALLAGLAALCVLLGAGQVGAQSTLGKPDPTVATVTTNSLTVLWVAPSDDGGSAITAYDLRHIETAATAAEKAIDANWTLEEERLDDGRWRLHPRDQGPRRWHPIRRADARRQRQ